MKKHLWIVGDFPSITDLERGTPFQSKRDGMLRKVLFEAVGATPELVHYDVLFPDITRNDWEKTPANKQGSDIEAHVLALHARIIEAAPRCVVAVGGVAMQALSGMKSDRLKDHRGKILDFLGDARIKVVPVWDSYFVERVRTQVTPYANDLMRAWNITTGKTSGIGKTNVVLVDTEEKFYELLKHVVDTGEFCFDFETTGLDVNADGFAATVLSVAFQHGGAWIIPLSHKDSPFTEVQTHAFMNTLRTRVFMNPNIRKTGHNLKYDLRVAWKLYGINDWCGRMDDTMLMKHLYDDTTPNGLKDIVGQYFPAFAGYEDEVGRYQWNDVPFNVLIEYAACDTDLTFRIRTFLEERLLKDMKLYRLYRNLSMGLLPVLTDIEMRGILIDRKKLIKNIGRAEELIDAKIKKLQRYPEVRAVSKVAVERAKEKEIAKIRETLATIKPLKDGGKGARETKLRGRLTGLKSGALQVDVEAFNFNSPPQLGELLYTKAGFGYKEVWDDQKKGPARKTDKDTLTRFEDPSGFITDLLTLRSLTKVKSTYLVGILERLDREDMLHSTYLQHGTFTGRLSSRDPNLQNIPDPGRVKWEEAQQVSAFVKNAFIVPEGFTMLQVDYSQAELRLMAMYAGETTMLEAYANGEDIHALTAAKLNGMTLEKFKSLDPDKMKTLRYHAKAGNFGLIYGMSAEGFKEYAQNDYGIIMSLEEATRIRNTFFRTYPGILDYHDLYVAKAQKFGYVRTFLGRMRHTPDIHDPNEFKRAMDERVAVNCVTDDTKALTQRGWLSVDELREGDQLYTADPETGMVEVQPCLKVNTGQWDGDMVAIENNAISVVSTPNHRWLVDRNNGGNITHRFTESSKLSNHGDDRIWVSAPSDLKGNGKWTDAEVEVIGWVLTDGYYKKAKGKNCSTIALTQCKAKNFEAIANCVAAVPGSKGGYVSKRGQHHWTISGNFARRVRYMMPDKTLTPAFLVQLSTKQLELLYNTMLLGDGSYDAHAGRYRRFTAGTEARADAFLMLCAMMGQPAHAFPRDMSMYTPKSDKLTNVPVMGTVWLVELKQRDRAYANIGKSTVKYTGRVWCPTVLNGTWIAKRNGKVFITGNSPIQGAAAELTLLAIVMLRQRLDPRIRMVNTVHDSIFFYVPDELVADAVGTIRATCTDLPTEMYFGKRIEGVTMAVDVEFTKENWGSMKPLQ